MKGGGATVKDILDLVVFLINILHPCEIETKIVVVVVINYFSDADNKILKLVLLNILPTIS